jgi:hypothetical protein
MITFATIEGLIEELRAANESLPPDFRINDWRGSYQREACRQIVEGGQWWILQGPVQFTGKTFIGGLLACAYLLEGYGVIVALPTLRQGSRVLLRRISIWMKVLEKARDIKRERDNEGDKTWANGATLLALSSDESAKRGTQGYTVALVLVDEGHDALPEVVIGPIFSRPSLAMAAGYGKIMVMGVGGSRKSLIVHCRIDQGQSKYFKRIHLTPKKIIEDAPVVTLPNGTQIDTAEAFERERLMNSDADYRKFYLCEDIEEGTRLIFPCLLDHAPATENVLYSVGIDVGKTTDYTMAVKLAVSGSMVMDQSQAWNIEDVFLVPHNLLYKEQAKLIHEWMMPFAPRIIPGSVTVETNGLGYGLLEALEELFPATGGVHMEDNAKNLGLKSFLTNLLRTASQNACFGVHKGLSAGREIPDLYEHFAALTAVVDEKGQVEWEHSDPLGALRMAIYGL